MTKLKTGGLVLGLWLCLGGLASAQTLVVTSTGKYYLLTEVAGEAFLQPVVSVVKLDESGGGGPVDPPASNLAAQVLQETAAVGEPTTAKALCVLYTRVDDADVADPFSIIKTATDALISARGVDADWANEWRPAINQLSVRAKQDGMSDAEIVTEIRKGICAYSDNAALGDRIDLDRLLRLVELILKILLPLLAG